MELAGLAGAVGDHRPALGVDLEHEAVGLLLRVAEELLEHEGDVGHEVDRVVPHEHDPGGVGLGAGVVDRLVDLDRRRCGPGHHDHRCGEPARRPGDGGPVDGSGIGSVRARWKRSTATHTSTDPSTWAADEHLGHARRSTARSPACPGRRWPPTSTRPRPTTLGVGVAPRHAGAARRRPRRGSTHTVALWIRATVDDRERQAVGGLVAAVGAAPGHERAGDQHERPASADEAHATAGASCGRRTRAAGPRRARPPCGGARRRWRRAPPRGGSGRPPRAGRRAGPPRARRAAPGPTTPATSPHDQAGQVGPVGPRRRAPSTARATATDTAPVKVRFTNSIQPLAPVAPRGTSEPSSQVGQVGQPMPEPVRRTAAPDTTIAPTATSAHGRDRPVGARLDRVAPEALQASTAGPRTRLRTARRRSRRVRRVRQPARART